MASELRVNTINSRTGFGTITVSETGQDLVGITTIENLTAENTLVGAAASFTGNVSVGGVLTYEDVTNVDSIGIITARTDINLGDSIIHIGDTDTKIKFPAADTVSVETGGTEAFRVTSDGNIAVNDTGFASYTTFSPCLAIGDSGDSTPGLVLRGSSTSNCDISFCDNSGAEGDDGVSEGLIRYEHSNDAMRFDTADSERLRIDSSGKVIIGNSGTPFGNAAVQAFIQHGNTAGESGFSSVDTTSVAEGVGGEIAFHGKYNTGAQDYAYLGHIRGIKENATNGNTACALTFHTRPNATAPVERLRIDSVGSALFTNGIQIGVDEGSSTSGGLLIHRYSSTSIDDGTDFNLVITWPHSNTGAFMVECFSGHSHYQGNPMYYKLIGAYGAHGSGGGITTTVVQETNANTVSVSDSSNATQRGNSSDYSVTITARSGQSNTGTSIDSHVHVYVHSRVTPTSVTIG